MPGRDGFGLLCDIRALGPDGPIAFRYALNSRSERNRDTRLIRQKAIVSDYSVGRVSITAYLESKASGPIGELTAKQAKFGDLKVAGNL